MSNDVPEDCMNNYEKELHKKIAKVVSFVCRNPLVFVSETDIHSLMMSALMEINCLKKMYKTNVTKNRKIGSVEK